MYGRSAFKVPLPSGVNRNVSEAKLMQKGSDVWVQLPSNTVVDKRLGKSVYMQDYNRSRYLPPRLRNVNAKVTTRHHTANLRRTNEDFMGDCTVGLHNCHSLSNSFNGMPSHSRYSKMKARRNKSVAALLPVMSGSYGENPVVSMDDHYVSSRKLSSSMSYNDKARQALPGLGKWSDISDMHNMTARKHCGTINPGDDFLENPYTKPGVLNGHTANFGRSVSFSLRPRTRSVPGTDLHEVPTGLDAINLGIPMDPPKLNNSNKRHDLEVLTRVDPHSFGSKSVENVCNIEQNGYTVLGEPYEHGNGAFFHTAGHTKGSFDIAPDWVSERKKSVVIRY